MSEVKRYRVDENEMIESKCGGYVELVDYEILQAENERLRQENTDLKLELYHAHENEKRLTQKISEREEALRKLTIEICDDCQSSYGNCQSDYKCHKVNKYLKLIGGES